MRLGAPFTVFVATLALAAAAAAEVRLWDSQTRAEGLLRAGRGGGPGLRGDLRWPAGGGPTGGLCAPPPGDRPRARLVAGAQSLPVAGRPAADHRLGAGLPPPAGRACARIARPPALPVPGAVPRRSPPRPAPSCAEARQLLGEHGFGLPAPRLLALLSERGGDCSLGCNRRRARAWRAIRRGSSPPSSSSRARAHSVATEPRDDHGWQSASHGCAPSPTALESLP